MKHFFNARFRLHRRRISRRIHRYPLVARVMHASDCLKFTMEGVARGVAVGLFIGLTPTVGVQTLLMIVGCIVLRGNFPAAFLVSWVSNPFTVVPLYWWFNTVGKVIFEPVLPMDTATPNFFDGALHQTMLTGLGSLLIAAPASALGYYATRSVWRFVTRHLHHEGRLE
ncbi:MAG: DUF2062 domain-containing protein [Gammaproteobacteria bacterium]|nr:DUF2062 domain-containing protein [Gammaproteobacteria bacterium]